ncbi:hypothetical protein [Paracerasibacillus soli]|uniref:Uncharacterized protein n=1 Tax=Paracerasibacillus soli TaxID=480284 RepID=A0ABU5CPQ4_9BACI|nr:hypothetical protein [Virgibacillus soli]MDY0407455.1 hypothetical protein [Virgibacillus soli]
MKTPNKKDKRLVDITLSTRLAADIDESITQLKNHSLIGVLELLNPKEQEIVEQGMNLLVSAVKERMIVEGMDNYEFPDILYFSEKNNRKK